MASTDVVELCAELVRIDTSNRGGGDAEGERPAAEFAAGVLADAGVDSKIYESAPGRANLVARIPGADRDLPALLVQGHLDVVPAEAGDWSVPPFAGEVRDGFLWGRGTVDMKDFCAMVLSVVQTLTSTGRRPRRDVVLAFVADEEDRGDFGAHWLTTAHRDLFEGCAVAISESGAYTYHVPATDGRDVRLYPVGTAERGTAHLRLTARGRAGHGSRRNDENAVVRLVGALHRLAEHEWPVYLTPTVRAFLVRTGAALGVKVDLCDVDATLARLGPAAALVESTVRNSTTPTVLDAGYKVNVIPSEAEALVDTRVLPGTETSLMSEVDRLLGPHIEREFIARQPPVQASLDSPWFHAMADALRAEDPEAVVVPYCMGGGTDAKAFTPLGIECYGFAPLWLPEGFPYRAMAHGVDERVPVEGLRFGARVLERFLTTC
ncbi:Acetylornithine deacetylase/Succinyl-diaminopimelate desuccinylase [Amycolatopsis arida]|uniref:Acetylornithine deacetylase/Succinyl-diaminopimelate desuccinylase n=1 Tax=Amycolatopsis arida TaxID=587909 RepID=A0A1I5ZEA8_9PSEU|nr:M20/M25/M40 family metallo-hydrolase [Amycolatopsis arida]TDX89576.1 acetylornithine deacetylase/succinyl-diaminopimelate desuccinylase-like protein [Amycolatopsis arida]SFQ54782.1 Acetylornithine deacetylase/Succinyl-diaminopimelate desuccinylase [Amycolatopsis arida]